MTESTFFELPEEKGGTHVEQWVDSVCNAYAEKLDGGKAAFPLELLQSVEADYLLPLMQGLVGCELDRPERTGILPPTWDSVKADSILGPLLSLILANREHTDRYQIQGMLGRGGFGIVWKALDKSLNRHVAIKVVRGQKSQIDRVFEEARFLASLIHPFVLQILHTIRTSDQSIWIITPFMKNGTLHDLCDKQPLDVENALRLTMEIVDALRYLHSNGIYHRDIKPKNVLIDENGHAVLADFGLAISSEDRHSGSGAGTPFYQAPEQLGDSVTGIDGRADLWSIGVLLYKLLTRDLPFFAERGDELNRQIKYASPKPLEESGQYVPRRLQLICLKLLEKDPSKRFQSAGELQRALKRELTLRWLQVRWKYLAAVAAMIGIALFYFASKKGTVQGEHSGFVSKTGAALMANQIEELRLFIARDHLKATFSAEDVDASIDLVRETQIIRTPYGSPMLRPLGPDDKQYFHGHLNTPTNWAWVFIYADGEVEVTNSGNTARFESDPEAFAFETNATGGNVALLLTNSRNSSVLQSMDSESLCELVSNAAPLPQPPPDASGSLGKGRGARVVASPYGAYISKLEEVLLQDGLEVRYDILLQNEASNTLSIP